MSHSSKKKSILLLIFEEILLLSVLAVLSGCSSGVERYLAKVEVESSNLFTRSIYKEFHILLSFLCHPCESSDLIKIFKALLQDALQQVQGKLEQVQCELSISSATCALSRFTSSSILTIPFRISESNEHYTRISRSVKFC